VNFGSPVHGQYLYDRNALVASQAVGRHLVAVTEAGHVLAFDAASIDLVGEALAPRKVTCIGPDSEEGVLVGFANGLIGRMAVPSLTITDVARIPGRPLWLGKARNSEERFVVYADANTGHAKRGSPEAREHTVRMLASGRDTRVRDGSAFFVDRYDRLWIGVDHGEWGGGLQVLNLQTGQLQVVTLPAPHANTDGIYGLAEVGDQVWAYGGMMHFGCAAFIARVSPGRPKVLYAAERPFVISSGRQRNTRPRAGPDCPITQIVEAGGSLAVMSFNDVFQTDPSIHVWKKRAKLDLRHLAGRPDAIGVYPAAGAPHVLDDRVLLPTIRDGYVEIQDGKVTSHALPGELPLAPSVIVTSSTELAVAGRGEGVGFRVENDWAPAESRWLPPGPGVGNVGSADGWCDSAFFSTPDSKLFAVGKWGPKDGRECKDAEGLLVTGVYEKGSFAELSRERTSLDIRPMNLLPDIRLVATDEQRSLVIQEHGAFRATGAPSWNNWIRKPLGAYESGWIVLGRSGLFTLNLERTVPSLSGIPLELDGVALAVHDALRLTADTLLVATDHGLCTYDLRLRVCAPMSVNGLDEEVEHIVGDPRGRIWIAGRGIFWLAAPDRAIAVAPFLPFLQDTNVKDVSLSAGRLAFALGARGLLVFEPSAVAKVIGAPSAPPASAVGGTRSDGPRP
jgi:hypothetical protein